jgi:hypothetical protein
MLFELIFEQGNSFGPYEVYFNEFDLFFQVVFFNTLKDLKLSLHTKTYIKYRGRILRSSFQFEFYYS